MRPTDRMDLINRISVELQKRFTFREIDEFLAAYKLKGPETVEYNSKRIYSREALRDVENALLLKITDDLDMSISTRTAGSASLPRNWVGTTHLRLFVSHISKDKDKATRIKDCLASHAISAFVAHEDIHPTLEWQREIERALYAMDAFLALHTPGFSQSVWTQQEIGFALGRDTKIISLRLGEDPTGFIGKQQAIPRRGRGAEAIAEAIVEHLTEDGRTSAKLKAARQAAAIASGEIPF